MRIYPIYAAEVLAIIEHFAAVYRGAFAGEPYNRQETEVAEFTRSLPMHTQRDGFICYGATLDGAAGAGAPLIGFAYGYRSQPGQWWFDNVARALGQHETAAWLSDAFQLAEIAVLPAHQGQGIGKALHDALLNGLSYDRAVLSTLDAQTLARAMYRARGWQDLLEGFYFPGVPRRYAIMGRRLFDQPE